MKDNIFQMNAIHLGFLSGSVVKNPQANAADAGGMGLIPGLGRSPEEGNGNLSPIFLPGKSYEQRSIMGCRPWSFKRVGHN